MARPPATLRAGRYLLTLLALLAVLYSVVFFTGQRRTPKLGIDLVGGVRVIYTALGHTTSTQMEQARQIMSQRVNGSGVTGATVQVQGQNQILILIPNGTGKDVENLGAAAKLNFRGVVAPAVPVTCRKYLPKAAPSGSASASPSASPSATIRPSGSGGTPTSGQTASAAKSSAAAFADVAKPVAARPLDARPLGARPLGLAPSTASRTASAPAATPASASPSAPTAASSAAAPPTCLRDPFAALRKADKTFTVPSADTAYNALPAAKQQAVQSALSRFDCGSAVIEPDRNDRYYIACENVGGLHYAYLLSKVIVPGTQIKSANAQAQTPQNPDITVNLSLKSSGSRAWAAYTAAHHSTTPNASVYATSTPCSPSTTPCAEWVAFTLNGQVISAPHNEATINGQPTQITGNFTETSANALAQQLQYGSLPLSFKLDANQQVSATLGSSQLKAALLAGGIGLILVVIYSLFYYRALGLVTIASLLVSAALTYALLVILGIQLGFTLDLAGITGFIVALGITADSFVVFFERIKDEVHEGRSVRAAVPRAWIRARRTILSADTVSFLAAAILYFFASADVKGFAFTLGLSTILDLIVVFLFTHPLVSLLSRSRAFGSARFTGLNSARAGGIVAYSEPAPARRSARTATAVGARKRGGASAAVLDRTDLSQEVEQDAVPDDALGETPEAASLSGASSPTASSPAATSTGASALSGTAAERAAARRARMRGSDDRPTDPAGDA